MDANDVVTAEDGFIDPVIPGQRTAVGKRELPRLVGAPQLQTNDGDASGVGRLNRAKELLTVTDSFKHHGDRRGFRT